MSQRSLWTSLAIVAVLVALGAATRLALRDIPNFAPVAALALFAGYLLPNRRLAAMVPLGVMAASDLVIGGYDWRIMAVVYGSLAAPSVLGHWLQSKFRMEHGWSAAASTGSLVGASLVSSIFFFATTNFAVWAFETSYDRSWAGIAECYVRAVPFFRYTLAGDLFFSSVLFSAFAIYSVKASRPAANRVACER